MLLINSISCVWRLNLSDKVSGGQVSLPGCFLGRAGVTIGSLCAVIRDGVPYFPCYDANGNVTEYVDEYGNIAAHYEYDAFGNTVREDGWMAPGMTQRFSTKYYDGEYTWDYSTYTEGYRFEHRPYSPRLGRFISRDPIEERGGLNLYGFCGNDPINKFDYLGLDVRIENTAAVGGWHQKVTVDVWDNAGNKVGTYAISFGVDGRNPGSSSQNANSSGGGSSGSSIGGSGSGRSGSGSGSSGSGSGSSGRSGAGTNAGKGSGIVYVDPDFPTATAATYKTNACLDKEIKKYLESLVGNRANYSVIFYNCRTFSRQQFNHIRETYKK